MNSQENKSRSDSRNQAKTHVGRTDPKTKTRVFGHIMRRRDLLGKSLMLAAVEGKEKEVDRGQDARYG